MIQEVSFSFYKWINKSKLVNSPYEGPYAFIHAAERVYIGQCEKLCSAAINS